MRRSVLVLSLLLLAAACGGESSILDAEARFPDAEGVVEDINLERIRFEGGDSYEIGDEVESFTTRSHEVTALLSWKGKYVQVGVDDDDVVEWIAGIGTVVRTEGSDPYTLYTGEFERIDEETDRAVFEDGTTLELGEDVEAPEPGEALVRIDPAERVIIEIDEA